MWSISRFQPSEIIEIAVNVEQQGASFYRRLADKACKDKVKDLLLYLASEEQRHEQDFKQLGENFEPVSPNESYTGEYLDYLQSVVRSHMFADKEWMEALVQSAKSETEIIRLAVMFEKDSILFFQSFRDMVKKDKRTVLDQLIREEEDHLIKLTKIKQN